MRDNMNIAAGSVVEARASLVNVAEEIMSQITAIAAGDEVDRRCLTARNSASVTSRSTGSAPPAMRAADMEAPRFRHCELVKFATGLLTAAGLERPMAISVARILAEADLLGHDTHGLAQCPDYLRDIQSGSMERSGGIEIVTDYPAAAVWDGNRLPGPWLVEEAIAAATRKAEVCDTGTIIIRRSHHIGCLAAYLERPARNGKVVLIGCSDPSAATVAPFGGVGAVMTPNPLGIGYPTADDPIMIDMSTSITTHAKCGRASGCEERLAGCWLVDAHGSATDDPTVLEADPTGALLPLGGLDHGRTGYSLELTVETLSQGLSGFGRAAAPQEWEAAVFVQVINPISFAGLAAFAQETQWLAEACRSAQAGDSALRVTLPGEAGLRCKAERLRDGVPIRTEVWAELKNYARGMGEVVPVCRDLRRLLYESEADLGETLAERRF
jgi:L-lactate dehydrogenase